MSAKPETLPVFQPFDRAKFAEVPIDDERALEDKIEHARRAFAARDAWLPPHERTAILLRMSQSVVVFTLNISCIKLKCFC